MDSKTAVKTLKTYVKENQNEKKIGLHVEDWLVDKAPRPSDLDWKNLAYDNYHRITRKLVIALFLIIIGFAMVFPF